MRILLRIIGIFGSWWLTAALIAALWVIYLAFSFGKNPYPAWIAELFAAPGGNAILVGLMLNLLAASIRIPLARFRKHPLTPGYFESLDAVQTIVVRDNDMPWRAADLLGLSAGSADTPDRGMRRVTGRWSFLPGTLFRAGLMLTLASLLVIGHSRRTDDATLAEGDHAELLGTTVFLNSIDADLPDDFLQVGDEGTLRLEGVSARIDVNGKTAVVTPGFPTRIKGQWFRIRHLGYSQDLTVGLTGSRNTVSVNLDVLPPGKHSIVSLPSGKAFLTFSLDPDRTITKGLLTGRQYNLENPSYLVRVQEGKPRETVQGMRMKPRDRRTVGPAEVLLGRQRLSIRLQAVSDPGLLPLYGGMILLLAGLLAMVSRFFWYEREVALLLNGDQLLIGARDEYYKRWGIERFQSWCDKLNNRP